MPSHKLNCTAVPRGTTVSLRGTTGYSLTRFNRKEFVTTLMLEKAMAAAARIGFNCRRKSGAQSNGARIPAAMGIRATL